MSEIKEVGKMDYYLVFYGENNGGREEANVFHSWLTQEATKQKAIDKVAKKMGEETT